MKTRCSWCGEDPLYVAYHDDEWGVPEHDDRKLFEFLILEGAQAGLSWITILRKRENYRAALHNFDYAQIAKFQQKDLNELLANEGIIRNRLKIESLVKNARGTMAVIEEFGSLDDYLWQFVDGEPILNKWATLADCPAQTKESTAMSKDLKKRGFNFVGSTICYAFMQAMGMVNDHTIGCFRHAEVQRAASSPRR